MVRFHTFSQDKINTLQLKTKEIVLISPPNG